MLDDIATADRRYRNATDHALGLWQQHWPDDPLVSIPGLGPIWATRFALRYGGIFRNRRG